MLYVWAVLLHSQAVTAAEKSSGLVDYQATSSPSIVPLTMAPANYACLHPWEAM